MIRLLSGPKEGWISLPLLVAVVLSPALSLVEARWVRDLGILPWVALAAILLGTVLAKLPVRGPVAHLFAAEIGLLAIATYFARMPRGAPWGERILWLWDRVWSWLTIAFGGGISTDTMLFGMLMALAAWTLGYLSAWFVFRRHNPWPPLVLCGAGLILNLSYMVSDTTMYVVVFLLAAMLLLVRLTLFDKERDWERAGAEYSRSLRWSLLRSGAILSGGILAAVWVMPVGNVNASVAENWYKFTEPWQGFQSEFGRVFATFAVPVDPAEEERFGRTMALGGGVELGSEPVMLVASPKPEYWGAQVYDRYTGQGWLSTADQVTRLDANDSRLGSVSSYRSRQEVEQRYKLLTARSTRTILAAGMPSRLSLAAFVDHFGSLDDLESLRAVVPVRKEQQYAVISSVSAATEIQLRRSGTDYPEWTGRYLELPTGSIRRVVTQARRVARGTDNPYDAALAIEQYLRRFRYETSLPEPPSNRDLVDWFIFTARAGYCDYFASAMAVMARSVGIPARVVSGYNSGEYNEQTGLYEVRQEHAHSWPELFFAGYGWVRFEPTPSQTQPPREPGSEEEEQTSDLTGETFEALNYDDMALDPLLLDDGVDPFGDGSDA